METINGEWIMKGCSSTAPDCLHSLDTLGKIQNLVNTDPFELFRIDGLGKKYREELFVKLENTGIDCRKAREKANMIWR